MKKFVIGTVILGIAIIQFLFSGNLNAGQKEIYKSIPGVFDIHYNGKYCNECHEKTPQKGGDTFLRFGGDFEKLCGRCHNSARGNYIHPVGLAPSTGKKGTIPPDFPLMEGKLSCKTCHDIYLQCQLIPKKRNEERTSLRGAPFKKRTDFCFKCHNEKNYEMQDAHDQLSEKGEVFAKKCLYCHVEVPNNKKDGFKNIKLVKNIEAVCKGCHIIRGNHSGNFNHMVKPSAKFLKVMKQMEITFGIIMPLDNKGKISCTTCHNPHEKGVILAESPAAKGADSKLRHRLPGKLCQECHKI